MIITVANITAAATLLVAQPLTTKESPKIKGLRVLERMRTLVADTTAYLSRIDQEKRLRGFVQMKEKQDALRTQEEDSVIAALRSEVLGGMNERMVRFKGIESSERITLLPGNGGFRTSDTGRDARRHVTMGSSRASLED